MQAGQIISIEELDEVSFSQRLGQVKKFLLNNNLVEPNFWLLGEKIEEIDPVLFVIITSWTDATVFNAYLNDPTTAGAKLRNFSMREPFKKPETGKVLELFSGFAKISEAEALRKNMLENVLPKIVSGAKGFLRIGYGFNIYSGPEDLHQFAVLMMWETLEDQKNLEQSQQFRPLLIDFNQHLKYIYMYNIKVE